MMQSFTEFFTWTTENILLELIGAFILLWLLFFLLASSTIRFTSKSRNLNIKEAKPETPSGDKPNTIQGYAFLFVSTVHSTIVATASITVVSRIFSSTSLSTNLLDQLRLQESFSVQDTMLITFAGILYESWVLFEIFFFTYYWKTFGKVEDMVHHILFAITGLFFIGNAEFMGYYAAILMSMEMSTPWLNLHLAFRKSNFHVLNSIGQV